MPLTKSPGVGSRISIIIFSFLLFAFPVAASNSGLSILTVVFKKFFFSLLRKFFEVHHLLKEVDLNKEVVELEAFFRFLFIYPYQFVSEIQLDCQMQTEFY